MNRKYIKHNCFHCGHDYYLPTLSDEEEKELREMQDIVDHGFFGCKRFEKPAKRKSKTNKT
jgi:hypothetical protein